MKKTLYIILSFLVSIALYFVITYLGSISFNLKLILGSFFYFLFTYYILKQKKITEKQLIFLILIVPPTFGFIYFNLLEFHLTIKSFPSALSILLSCALGFFYYSFKKNYIPVVWILSLIFWFFIGQSFFINKITYGSYTKNVDYRNPINNLYVSPQKKAFIDSYNKIIVLDFWNSKCAPCFNLFPFISKVNSKIDTTKIKIYVVNIPLKGETIYSNFSILDKFNYNLNQLFADNSNIVDSIGIYYFPTTIIIKNDKIIYKGDFEDAITKAKSL